MSRYRRIAQITRAKGLTGEVVVVSDYNLPLHFWQGRKPAIVPPDFKLPRFAPVTAATPFKGDGAAGDTSILKLSGIDDRTTAQQLVGRYLLLPKSDCTDLESFVQESAVGLEVISVKHGSIGTIIEERLGKAQELWVVDGAYGEVLIPVVEDFIVALDEKTVTVELPEGLLELNV